MPQRITEIQGAALRCFCRSNLNRDVTINEWCGTIFHATIVIIQTKFWGPDVLLSKNAMRYGYILDSVRGVGQDLGRPPRPAHA